MNIFVKLYLFFSVSVRCGEFDLSQERDCEDNGYVKQCSDPPQNVEVEWAKAHEDYNPLDTNQLHDIAIIRLARKLKYSCKYRAKNICTSFKE